MPESSYTAFGNKGMTVRLILRRVRPTPGSQLAPFTEFSHHAMGTDREGGTVELEADHRRHAAVETAIRDQLPARTSSDRVRRRLFSVPGRRTR